MENWRERSTKMILTPVMTGTDFHRVIILLGISRLITKLPGGPKNGRVGAMAGSKSGIRDMIGMPHQIQPHSIMIL